jgi:lysophospholipase L1-like esterase
MTRLDLCKFVLAPVLLAQGRRLRQSALRLPEPDGKRAGVVVIENGLAELNLLFVGDSTMAGVGVSDQKFALGLRCAEAVARQLSRSVCWQIVAKSGLNTGRALEFATREKLLVADVLITALGTNDVLGQTMPAKFIEDYQRRIEGLDSRRDSSLIVINGMPPLHLTPGVPQPLRWFFGKYARVLDRELQHWTAPQSNLAYISLQWASDTTELAEDGFHPGERQYDEWAERIASRIVAHFR